MDNDKTLIYRNLWISFSLSLVFGIIALYFRDDFIDRLVGLSNSRIFSSSNLSIFDLKIKTGITFALYFQVSFLFTYKLKQPSRILFTYLYMIAALLIGLACSCIIYFLEQPFLITDGNWFDLQIQKTFIQACVFAICILIIFYWSFIKQKSIAVTLTRKN